MGKRADIFKRKLPECGAESVSADTAECTAAAGAEGPSHVVAKSWSIAQKEVRRALLRVRWCESVARLGLRDGGGDGGGVCLSP